MMKEKTAILIFKIFPLLQSLTQGGLAHRICSLRYCIKMLKITCYTVLIERRTENKCNVIVSLLEVLISTKKTTSTTSWSTLLMICQNFAMSDPTAIHLPGKFFTQILFISKIIFTFSNISSNEILYINYFNSARFYLPVPSPDKEDGSH